jgi:RimJ/RimL family protein N-acetyltransferase
VINDWSPEDRSANLRILIGPAGRDRGLGSEAVRLLVDHAFAATDLERISLEVMDFNPRARRVYERAGFVEEGRLRGAFRFDDEPVDVIVMALLRTDPRD